MLRFVFLIVTGLFYAVTQIIRLSYYASHEEFTEEQRYSEAVRTVNLLKKKGRISTLVYGTENLPSEDGYIMYSNHQGKYDALGIIYGHKKPMSVLMEDKRSKVILVKQFIDALKGKRIQFNNPRQQIQVINEIAQEVMEGRRYLIFPEGGYADNHNHIQQFSTGCFKCASKSKCPIVPVCIIDSWKPFGINSLKKVVTQVHFLEAIEYIEYAGKSSRDISIMVKERISDKLSEVIGEI